MKMIAACLLLLVTGSAFAAGHPEGKHAIACTTGPVTKAYGGMSWLVYGCADARSVLVVRDGDSQSSEYIMLSPARKGVRVVSEGWGEEGNGNPVFAKFKAMSASDLRALLAETRGADH